MPRWAAVAWVVMLVSNVACGGRTDGPPSIEVDRTPCAHCGMLISEPRFAAAYQPAGSEARVFDDIACLVQAVAREAEPGALRFWFHDANTAAWMTGAEAVFVKSERFRTPMAGGVVAYRGEAAARQAATESGGRVIGSLDDLLAEGRKGGGM